MKGPSPRSRVHLVQQDLDDKERATVLPPSKIIEASRAKIKLASASVASENSEGSNAVISLEDHENVVDKVSSEIVIFS